MLTPDGEKDGGLLAGAGLRLHGCAADERGPTVADVGAGGMIAPTTDAEMIVRGEEREISILVAHEAITITHARYPAAVQVAGAHVHHEHTDAFYVLEGELMFEIGCEGETVMLSSGGFVAVPPHVAHSFRTGSDRPARWLAIHTPDGGFASFMRGVRDGVEVDWDISTVPAGGGSSASEAIVSHDAGGAALPTASSTRST